jgi:hypothetical protein
MKAAMTAQEAPLFDEGSLLWHALGKLTKDTSTQCSTDLNGDDMISEEEAALFVTINTIKCDIENKSENCESINSVLSKKLDVASLERGQGNVSDLGNTVPEFKVANTCFSKIENPTSCPGASAKQGSACMQAIEGS